MKKYNSPICEVEAFAASDVITASEFTLFSFLNIGKLDDDSNVDKVQW